MNPVKHVCFDLDGTLLHSYNTIYKTTVKTLEYLHIPEPLKESEFYKRIGHHFLDIFRDLKIDVPDIEHFINVYKSFYFEFIDDSELYPGAADLLAYLQQNNIKVSLLTTKAQDQAEKILEHFNLAKYFSYIMGRRIGREIKPSPEPLIYICKDLKVNVNETLMTGDSELDVICAKAAGAKSCAVEFGYRSLEILKAENPDYIIKSLSEIKNLVQLS